jgi:hypothetical protein
VSRSTCPECEVLSGYTMRRCVIHERPLLYPNPSMKGTAMPNDHKLIDVGSVELLAGLRAVMPHACADKTLPMLHAVHFDIRDGKLYLAATDRYTLGIYRCSESGDGFTGVDSKRTGTEDFSFTLDLADVKLVLLDAKAVFTGPLRFAVAEEYVQLRTDSLIRTMKPVEKEFPGYRSLIAGTVEAAGDASRAGVTYQACNPAFLSRFAVAAAAIGGRGTPVVLHHTTVNKPALVTVGVQFAGMIMPVRVESVSVPSWVPGAAQVRIAKLTPEVKLEPKAETPQAKPAVPPVKATVPVKATAAKVGTEARKVAAGIRKATPRPAPRPIPDVPITAPGKKAAPRKAA